MKTFILLTLVILFLIGCSSYIVETPNGGKYMTLDEALSYGRKYYEENSMYYSYMLYLSNLREHAANVADKAKIDQEIAVVTQKQEATKQKSEPNLYPDGQILPGKQKAG
jgi:hypothetical protein